MGTVCPSLSTSSIDHKGSPFPAVCQEIYQGSHTSAAGSGGPGGSIWTLKTRRTVSGTGQDGVWVGRPGGVKNYAFLVGVLVP